MVAVWEILFRGEFLTYQRGIFFFDLSEGNFQINFLEGKFLIYQRGILENVFFKKRWLVRREF